MQNKKESRAGQSTYRLHPVLGVFLRLLVFARVLDHLEGLDFGRERGAADAWANDAFLVHFGDGAVPDCWRGARNAAFALEKGRGGGGGKMQVDLRKMEMVDGTSQREVRACLGGTTDRE